MVEAERSLTMLHLRKTFIEYCKLPLNDQKEDDQKFDRVLPLFYKVMNMYPNPEEILDQFKEICNFTGHLCRHLVQEMRLRAANQSTELAALSISTFLLPSSSDMRGWMLLNSANYLVLTGQLGVIDAICKAALPSTLVKALYLFFDLPHNSDQLLLDARQDLCNFLLNFMDKLCGCKCVGEELARKDDLFLLFAGSSSSCALENVMWRKVASQLLMTTMSKGLSSSVIKYIHTKECIQHFISNMAKENDSLPIHYRFDMVICLLCVLKDLTAVTNMIIQDFSKADGYKFLRDFILKNEEEEEGTRNVLLMIMSIVTSGTVELQPKLSPELFAIPSFHLPSPSGNGLSARNIDAFKLLIEVFTQSKNEKIMETVVDVISNIYASDAANYFIVDKECPLSQLVEHMQTRSLRIQRKVLELVEYVVFHLNHVPCKELIALSIVLKMQISVENYDSCAIILQSKFRILSANSSMKDAFREVGLVEAFIWIITYFIPILKERGLTECEAKVALLSTDILSVLVSGNNANAKIFRESSGAKLLVELMCTDNAEWRASALQLLKQLLILGNNEEQLSALFSILQSSSYSLFLKSVLLKSLLCILRESHKVRVMFRRVGGYVCIMSILVSMEGKLNGISMIDSTPTAKLENMEEIFSLLRFTELIFKVFAISMRYEPSNARHFSQEIRWDNLCLAIRVSGAFSEETNYIDAADSIWQSDPSDLHAYILACHHVFQSSDPFHLEVIPADMPLMIFLACCIIRFLFNIALDNYEKPDSDVVWSGESCLLSMNDPASSIVSWTSSVLVHPGALLSILHLLPAIRSSSYKWLASAQLYCSLVVKALLRPERNQQIMCQFNMARSILKIGKYVLKSEKHLLLAPFYYILERLSSHAITPTDLRHFLRLDMPLCCRNLEEAEDEEPLDGKEGGPVPIGRVKALVSMMTPRDHLIARNPSFVEFDMAVEGFACMLIPSLAPISPELGGVGHGERMFPPLSGLTVASWLYIEQFSDKRTDPHPIRLFTIFRSYNSPQKKGENTKSFSSLNCFSVQLSYIDRSLLICTSESETAGNDLEQEKNASEEVLLRVTLADVIVPRQWFHIAVVLTRAILKHSQVSVYVNGQLECTQKLNYIVQNVGGAATHLAQTCGVHAVIGTLPIYRSSSRLRYKIASFAMIEEPLCPEAIQKIFRLEPHYVGNFQTADTNGSALVPEERICLSLSAVADAELSVSRIGSIYSRADSIFIAPYLGVSVHDKSTPLRVLLNTVSHASGPARSFGAVLLGYLGMRTFAPRPVTRLLESVGGASCLFGLVAMSTDSQELYASLKALTAAVKTDKDFANQLISTRSYQTLAVLLEEKNDLLNSHILHLILSLVGTLDTSKDTVTIPNMQIFEDVFCDLDVWKNVNNELNRLLYEHFYELITDQQRQNLALIRKSTLPSRLLLRLFDTPQIIFTVNDIIFNIIAAVLQPPTDNHCLLKIGQFITATIPISHGSVPNESDYPISLSDLQSVLLSNKSSEIDRVLYNIYVRNRILNIIASALMHSSTNYCLHTSEQIVKVLGFDWLLTLFAPDIHTGTVILALRILLKLLKHENLLCSFKDGSSNGAWLTDADSVVRNRAAVLLGFSVSAHYGTVGAHIDINPELSECGGFAMLEHLMPFHIEKPECYLAMFSVLVGQPVSNMNFNEGFSLDLFWSHVFGLSPSSSVSEAISSSSLCPDAIIPLLSMVRSAIHSSIPTSEREKINEFSSTTIQLFTFFYQSSKEFNQLCLCDDFIICLFSVLIPTNLREALANSENPVVTPTSNAFKTAIELPCYRSVQDLLKRILSEDIFYSRSGRGDSLLDALIENVPEFGSAKRYHSVVLSELLVLCMDHLIATDVLMLSMKINNTGSAQVSSPLVHSNFAYFASRVVDCLWSGLYTGEATRVLDFLFKGIALCRRNESKGSCVDTLMHSSDRTILYLLSRPIDSVKVQMSILDTLSEIVTNRAIVLSPMHNDPAFFGPLTHLLFMLSVTPDLLSRNEEGLDHGSAQVALCASRVWQEVCNLKRVLLEDIFRRGFVCELNAARALLSNAASLQWQSFVDSQMNSTVSRNVSQIHQQIQSKITKVATGLQRLASRKGQLSTMNLSTYAFTWRQPNITSEIVHMWIRVHTLLIHELLCAQCTSYHEWHSHVQKWCLQEWHSLEAELTRERGIWGPEIGCSLDKFMLDMTEGPCRIRRKLVPNPLFYHNYPYRPHLESLETKALRAKVAISRDSKFYYEAMKRRRCKTIDSKIIDVSTMINTPNEEQGGLFFNDLQEISSSMIRRVSIKHSNTQQNVETDDVYGGNMGDKDANDIEDDTVEENSIDVEQPSEETNGSITREVKEKKDENIKELVKEKKAKKRAPDNQTLLRLLEQGEQLHSMFRCARIQGLDTSEGLLLFGREHYYVVDGFTLLKTREIRDLDFLPPELHDPIVPYMACGTSYPVRRVRSCSKFSYDDIREVHRRRYLLQPIAIEVFSADGRNYLLAFPKKMRNRVYQKFISVAKALKDGGNESVSGQRASLPVEQSGRVSLLTSLIGQQSVTQRWVRGELSNFQYLMHLNTLAGRSYNDLSQYPIFPWVLKDYESEVLDLTNPYSFRDLSCPMGAQSAERLEQFMKRYREWDDPTGETPPYMYGTHYSSAMIVVSYLVRLEPFTQQFLKLQGGHFDLADRMFHSVGDAWLSASRNNMADVKELVPEFFSLPEMFVNSNRFDLGIKQNGVSLDDVALPLWAKGDPREFVRLHREALECDFVSANLHNWIDLIFGYKQHGDAAIEAHNVYHHLFYEGNVDFENIQDPLTRNATIGFINNFGQIPTQLFKKPHPQKKVTFADSYSSVPGVTTQRLFYHALDMLKVPQQPIKELRSAVGSILATDKGILALEENRIFLSTNRYLSWGFPDRSIRIGVIDTDKSCCVYELCETSELTCCTSPDSKNLFTGSTTGKVCMWSVSDRTPFINVKHTFIAHTDAITALKACSAQTLLVSASRDCTAILWHLSALTFIRQLRPHPSSVTAVAINESTGDIATASLSLLFIWSINGQLLAVVNSTDSSPINSHQNLILAIAFSSVNEWDPLNVIICGGSDGVVRIYSLEMGEVDVDNENFGNNPEKSISNARPIQINALNLQQRRILRMGSSKGSSLDTPSATGSIAESPEPPHSLIVHDIDDNLTTIWNSSLRQWHNTSSSIHSSCEQRIWPRLLVLRSSLTTHTAFGRDDNIKPAPITAISPSKDHKSLYVGDGIGRVWQWQMGDEIGNRADHWIQDPSRNACIQCSQKFSIAERRHHCRNCGHIFCNKCTRFETDLKHMRITKPVRVCQCCYLRLKAQGSN